MDRILVAFAKYIEGGGYVMPPLIAATLMLWFGLGFRASALRRGRGLEPRHLVQRVRADQLGRPRSVVERSAVLAMLLLRRGSHNLRARIEDVFAVLERDLRRFDVLTKSLIAIAPLLGLLGTVSGMIETFDSLGDMTLYSQSGGIAGGISQALLTTQFGLAVAIPGLIVRGLLERRQRVLESEMEEVKELLCGSGAEEARA